MKLECPIVKDLYVLYIENELSPEGRKAVEEHINHCIRCREVYDTGNSFSDVLDKKTEELPERLDEKLIMRLKIARMKIALCFAAVILISILLSSYSVSRVYLRADISSYAGKLHTLDNHLKYLKNSPEDDVEWRRKYNNLAQQMVIDIDNEFKIFYRNLNFIERRSLKQFVDSHIFREDIYRLISTLHHRSYNGYWSDKDEKVYRLLKDEMENLIPELVTEGNRANSRYYIINAKKLEERLSEISRLAHMYVTYNELPGDKNPLAKEILRERISYILDDSITLGDIGSYREERHFRIKGKGETRPGIVKVEAYTGTILSYNNPNTAYSREPVGVATASETARKFALRNFGTGFDIQLKQTGNSENKDRYAFEFEPTFGGYKILYQGHIVVDAHNNKVSYYFHTSNLNSLPKVEELKIDIKYHWKDGLNNNEVIHIIDRESYQYKDTIFIKSLFSGEYVLVHEYVERISSGFESQKLYINTSTGRKEWPASLYYSGL
jgi:hypothetical protein